MKIRFDKSIYPKIAVLSGVSYFSKYVLAEITEDESNINVNIVSIHGSSPNDIIEKLYSYVLQISIRHIISENNKVEREIIIGRALYGSCFKETE